MKKTLLFISILFTVSLAFSQTTSWLTRPADNANLGLGDPLTLEVTFDAGDDGMDPLTEYVVGGATLGTFQYSLQTRTGAGTVEDPYETSWVSGIGESATVGAHSGTSTLNWTVPNATLSADLPAGTTYVLKVVMQNSNNAWASGAEDFPVVLVAGAVAPSSAWGSRPTDNAVLNIGEDLNLSATYDAGNSSGGVEYTIGGAQSMNLQFSISEKTGNVYTWKAGKNDTTTNLTHSGTSTVSWTVPDITLSADLPSGTTHVLRVGYQNDQNTWASGAAEIPITIEAAVANVVDEDKEKVTIYPNPTTGEILFKGLSNVEIVSILDVTGKIIGSFQLDEKIDISDLPAGVYTLQSDSGLNRQVIKI